METLEHIRDAGRRLARLSTLIGFIAGVVWLLGMRVLLFNPPITHYHANFAIYINGERLNLDDPNFYEEISSCSTTNTMEPKSRVHLHEQNAHLIHIHDDAATWGHLFANLGMTLGNTVLKTRDALFIDDQANKQLVFMLNGEIVPTIANRTIESEDVLLISYGDARTVSDLQPWYDAIPRDAAVSNTRPDPSSCSGPSSYSWRDRVKKSLDITK